MCFWHWNSCAHLCVNLAWWKSYCCSTDGDPRLHSAGLCNAGNSGRPPWSGKDNHKHLGYLGTQTSRLSRQFRYLCWCFHMVWWHVIQFCQLYIFTFNKGGGECFCQCSFVCLSCLLARLLKNACMKCCMSTDVETWTNWLTFEPDPDYSLDAGTRLLSLIFCKRCYAKSDIMKVPLVARRYSEPWF